MTVAMILFGIGGLLLGSLGVYLTKKYQDESKRKSARHEAERIINRAKSEAAKIDRDSKNRAKDFEVRARKNVESEIQKQKSKLKSQEGQFERRLKELEEENKRKLDDFERQVSQLREREEKIGVAEVRQKELERKTEQKIEELQARLESVSKLSMDEAKKELFKALEGEARAEVHSQLQKIEEEAQAEAEKRAKRILSVALSRYASEYTTERTVTVLALPNEEMKGKIIGREGRNIRTLESLCGVDVIVDDTPESVVISGFDPVRREVAKKSLEKLMEDGRVHPARIEEVVDKVRADLMKFIREDGEKACLELGVSNVHPELIKLIGGLKYRTTHQQNVLHHSIEVANIAGLLAGELGFNVKIARRAGLLHDIGKAIEHTMEGSHAVAGAEFARKHGEHEQVCLAIRAHEGEEKADSLLAQIVYTANLISNARPGARRPNMDNYIQRLSDLESIGNSFDGVVRTFALQAGKEVRVIVESSKVTDDQAGMLSRDIARKIERELSYPSPVKVAVVRETRAVEFSR